ncbi:MAG: hypothetical protein EBZ59_13615 [Planctomycetia bacterium]|nr:hypothetical protein [Planctomycetia bacterium]
MIRHVAFALAVAAMAFSMDAALAGGRPSGGSSKSGNSKSNAQYVRIKNIGAASALVNAANTSSVAAAGGKTLAQNGVAQFNLKKLPGSAIAANTGGKSSSVLPYNFPKSQYVYLQAQADAAAASITFAPAGTTF